MNFNYECNFELNEYFRSITYVCGICLKNKKISYAL